MLSCLRRSKRLAPQARAPVGGTNNLSGLSFAEDPCANVRCENGSSCKDGACILCPEGFVGCRCEVDICKFVKCLNKGMCEGGKCKCVDGYTGDVCEKEPDSCLKVQCKNGGTCMDGKCKCASGFEGPTCEKVFAKLNNVLVHKGMMYATLDDSLIEGDPSHQSQWLPLPSGWELADDNDVVLKEVVAPHTWSAYLVGLRNGSGIATRLGPTVISNFYAGSRGWSGLEVGTGENAGKYRAHAPWGLESHRSRVKVLIQRKAD